MRAALGRSPPEVPRSLASMLAEPEAARFPLLLVAAPGHDASALLLLRLPTDPLRQTTFLASLRPRVPLKLPHASVRTLVSLWYRSSYHMPRSPFQIGSNPPVSSNPHIHGMHSAARCCWAGAQLDALASAPSIVCTSLAMGSAAAQTQAEQAVRHAAARGGWVILKNLHLVDEWLPNLTCADAREGSPGGERRRVGGTRDV